NFFLLLLLLLTSLIFIISIILKSRNIHIWIIPYIKQKLIKVDSNYQTKHVYVCLADHHEPYFSNASEEVARERERKWLDAYRKIAYKFSDSDGNHPVHSYFYPEEEYDEWILDQIQKICEEGLGDVDIHLHHDNDTAENLLKTLNDFKYILNEKHNLLRKDENGNIVYGFIHGNWALDNSRPDGKWCGVDNEIDILIKTGCVYDMTMPSAPSDTQTSTINSIYIAKEDGFCKSHDKGRELVKGDWPTEDELLMIQGPLELNWKSRKLGIIPRIESSELSYDAPPNLNRVKLWEKSSICVKGAEDHIFIKLHTHGLEDQNFKMFFELNGFENLWSLLEKQYKDREGYSLHYVSAWDMYQKIKSISSNSEL
ncbi:MAG: hypothetical protein QM500_02600, partial [Methylococcales bacterium]